MLVSCEQSEQYLLLLSIWCIAKVIQSKPFFCTQPSLVQFVICMHGHTASMKRAREGGDPVSSQASRIWRRKLCDYANHLHSAPPDIRGNREIVRLVVRNCGDALQFATEELRGDREVVMEAVTQNGDALRWASQTLQNDCKVAMIAISQDPHALQFAGEVRNHQNSHVVTHLLSLLL